MKRTKPWAMLIFSSFAVAGIIAGLYLARQSSLFLVRVVEVVGQPEDAPLGAQQIIHLADIPTGKMSLFKVNFKDVEKRLLSNSWVKSVILSARLPQTLSIQMVYRKPVALAQSAQGILKYVDSDGSTFGPVTLKNQTDLPLIHGLPQGAGGERALTQAMDLLRDWGRYPWKVSNQISQLSWDEDAGFTLWVALEPSYRLSVVLGADFDSQSSVVSFKQIDRVFQYSVDRALPVRQIFADANKKIVVRTARGS